MRKSLFIALLTFFNIGFADKPVTLLQSFADAARNDPTYQAQTAIYNERVQEVPEKRSVLLPQLSMNAEVNRELQKTSQFPGGTFNTRSYSLLASQTIFNFTQFKELSRAAFAVQSAYATLCAQQQDLMIRTAKAYFDVLQARDLLNFTEQQKGYISTQLHATQTLFEHNHATITDLEQARGAKDLIDADLYTARIDLYDAIQTLSQITAIRYEHFAHLNRNFPLIRPVPENIETWVQTANAKNLNLRASRIDIQAAREALHAREGGFLPSVTANAGLTNAVIPNSLLTDVEKSQNNFVGLSANWNVFQGGLTLAEVRAAVARLQQRFADMQKQCLEAMADTRKAYTGIMIGVSRVRSSRLALASNTRALKSAQEAYKAGELTITEVLQIQGQLFNAQKQYVQVVYSYLLDLLLLKQATGTLNVNSLAIINNWLNKD